jgi:hypothetical protein
MTVEVRALHVEIPEPLHVEARKRSLDLRIQLREYVRILLEEDLRKPLSRSAAAIPGEIEEE